MSPGWRTRRGGARYGAVAAPLALALLVTVALAWSGWAARAAHRRAAERTVQDYAGFAATLLAREAEAAMGQTLLYAFYAVDLAERRGSPEPVRPEELAANPPEAGRCAHDYPEGRWFARLGRGEADLDVVGPLRPELGAWLVGRLTGLLEQPDPPRSGNLFPEVGGRREVVAWRIRRDPAAQPLEIHAVAHCFEAREPTGPTFASVFATAGRRSPLLPPGLVGDAPEDSLLSLTVTDRAGGLVHRSPVEYGSAFHGVHRAAGGPLDGLEVRVVLRPELSERLVAGGLPRSRLPTTVALVALTGGLLAATLVQVLRSLQLARLRERFVADVSHELRTPLQQILIFVQLLRLGRLGSERERAESLEIVERETHRLIRLVERLLTFARPPRGESGTEAGTAARTGLGPALREAVRTFGPLADAAGARLELEPAHGEVAVAIAPGALRQVLVNVLDNALKYGPRGQRIRIRAERAGTFARVTVDDQGPGVPPPERERVWEAFHRLEREEASAVAGSGIGLSIVREILEESGGRGELTDAPGGGTRVSLELPLAPPVSSGSPSGTGTDREDRATRADAGSR